MNGMVAEEGSEQKPRSGGGGSVPERIGGVLDRFKRVEEATTRSNSVRERLKKRHDGCVT